MALFIVLWLMNSSDKIKKAVAGYFNDPKGTANLLGTTMSGAGVNAQAANIDNLQKLKEKLEQEIKERKQLEKLSKQIEITITPEGLRVELLEGKNGTFYQSGSARLSASGQELLALLAAELKTLPNALLIEGHTDAMPYSRDTNYSNWELSADRANSARRLLQQDGVRSDQVTQVRGYADQLLRNKDNPTDPANRRISILVKNGDLAIPALPGTKIVGGPQSIKAPATQSAAETNAQSASPTPAAQPKPSPSKPGLIDRIKGMMPGAKK
jgi:chemotaxis protein MotB